MSAIFPPLDDDGLTAQPPDPELARLRLPPHSIEAESSVLGGLLLDNNAWDRVGDLLVQSHLYRHEHQMIYTAIGVLITASQPRAVWAERETPPPHGGERARGGHFAQADDGQR